MPLPALLWQSFLPCSFCSGFLTAFLPPFVGVDTPTPQIFFASGNQGQRGIPGWPWASIASAPLRSTDATAARQGVILTAAFSFFRTAFPRARISLFVPSHPG